MTSTSKESPQSFSVHDRVLLTGLIRRPEFNGCTGVIIGKLDHDDDQRYTVKIINPDTRQTKTVRLKTENLRPLHRLHANPTTSMRTVMASEDDTLRNAWSIGSRVELFSNSANKWAKGKIIDVFHDHEGEWLLVQYQGFRQKEIQRLSNFLRPIKRHQKRKNHGQKEALRKNQDKNEIRSGVCRGEQQRGQEPATQSDTHQRQAKEDSEHDHDQYSGKNIDRVQSRLLSSDRAARASWTKGSSCEMYCPAQDKWLAAVITDVATESGQEWLRVRTVLLVHFMRSGKTDPRVTRRCLRSDAHIRPSAYPNSHPIAQPTMKRMDQLEHVITSSSTKYVSLHRARMLVFGFVRKNSSGISELSMELCRQYFPYDVLCDHWHTTRAHAPLLGHSLQITSDPRLRGNPVDSWLGFKSNQVRLICKASAIASRTVTLWGNQNVSGSSIVTWKLLIEGTPRLVAVREPPTQRVKAKFAKDDCLTRRRDFYASYPDPESMRDFLRGRRDNRQLEALVDYDFWVLAEKQRAERFPQRTEKPKKIRHEIREDLCALIGVVNVGPRPESGCRKIKMFYGMYSENGDFERLEFATKDEWTRSYYKKEVRSGDIVEVHLDLILGQLSYSVNGEYLGVAYEGIDCNETYRLAVRFWQLDADVSIGSSNRELREWKEEEEE